MIERTIMRQKKNKKMCQEVLNYFATFFGKIKQKSLDIIIFLMAIVGYKINLCLDDQISKFLHFIAHQRMRKIQIRTIPRAKSPQNA